MIDIYSIKVGDQITPAMGLELCRYFGFDYLIERLDGNPDKYEPFIFDGVSGLHENVASFLTDVPEKKLTYHCALPHDILYWAGEEGNVEEKERADIDFKNRLIKHGCPEWKAKVAKFIVDTLGEECLGQKFSWGFGKKK